MRKGMKEAGKEESISSSDASLSTVATFFPSPVTCTREDKREPRLDSRSETVLLKSAITA